MPDGKGKITAIDPRLVQTASGSVRYPGPGDNQNAIMPYGAQAGDPQSLRLVYAAQGADVGVWARIKAAARYVISGASSWMGPLSPLSPVAPPEVQAERRQYDFPTGVNLRSRPRAEEPVDFWQLRALADNCDILRLGIETCKDRMEALTFTLAWRNEDQDTNVMDDPRAKAIMERLLFPDRVRPWAAWLRMVLEERYVTDAACVAPRLDKSGNLWALELLDGATLKVLIDSTGRRPMPPEPAYAQYLKGVPVADFTLDDLIYAPRNERVWKLYGMSPVEQVLMTVNILLRRQVSQLQYFTEGNIPEAVINVPETWTPEQMVMAQAAWDAMHLGRQEVKRQIRFVPGGKAIQMLKESPIKDEFDEWLTRVVCYALSLPPTAFIKQMNRATAGTAQEVAEEEGQAPTMLWVKNLMDLIIARCWNAPDIVFQWNDIKTLDPNIQSQIEDRDLKNGSRTLNEVRTARGADPYPAAIGDRPMVYTASGPVPIDTAIENADNPPEPQPAIGGPGQGQQALPAPKGDIGKARKRKPVGKRVGVDARKTKALHDKITPLLHKLRNSVVSQLSKHLRSEKLTKATPDEVAALLAKLDMGELDVIDTDLYEALKDTAADGGLQAYKQIGIDDEDITALANKAAEKYAKERAGEFVTEISNSTRDMLKTTVTTAVEEGWGTGQLAQELSDEYAFSSDRAAMIAQSELKMADSYGALKSYQDSGVVEGKEWQVANESTVCDVCAENADAGVIDLEDEFPSGDDAPGAHPNCDCILVPVVYADESEKVYKLARALRPTVTVSATAPHVHVHQPGMNIKVETPPAQVSLSLPAREKTTEVLEHTKDGLVKRFKSIEKDA